MNFGGADVCFTANGEDVATYIVIEPQPFFQLAHGTALFSIGIQDDRRSRCLKAEMVLCNVWSNLILAVDLVSSSMRAQSPNETRSIEAAFVHSGLDTGPVVQGAVRIDGELVLKRFVARNVKPITPIVWNQVIGDQLFSEIEGGQVQGEPLPAREGIRIEPAAPDVAETKIARCQC